jgi:pyrroloquinoline quinone biosynthesis protein B
LPGSRGKGATIFVRVLGSAAGGGLPQWNCCCPNCRLARSGRLAPQLQSSIAISGDGKSWWLIDASSDLPAQIASFRPLQPQEDAPRNSPIAGVLLSSDDIDHVAGILSLRQRESALPIYTSSDVRAKLGWLDELMQPFCGIDWRDLPRQFAKLADGIGFLGTELPRSVAFQLKANRNRRLLVAPSVSTISGELDDAIKNADAIFFDGTFWSNDELSAICPGALPALKMGHMPVERSLLVVSESNARRKVYIHINNTNPILTPGSDERLTLEAAGITIGYDGLEFEL